MSEIYDLSDVDLHLSLGSELGNCDFLDHVRPVTPWQVEEKLKLNKASEKILNINY